MSIYANIVWVLLIATLESTSAQPRQVHSPLSIDIAAPPARSIRAYNLFKDVARQIPNDGLIPFDVNAPLFSDYTVKHRFLYVPDGMKVQYHPDQPFDFPIGTVLVKSFAYPRDRRDPSQGEHLIETRLLMHRPEGWVGYPYVWSEDLSDARLVVAGARVPVSWIHDNGVRRDMVYTVPNMNHCKMCHKNNDVVSPIGPKARQLNRVGESDPSSTNQLMQWIEQGLLIGAPATFESIPRMPSWADTTQSIDVRGRAYLDGNCAHCHAPGSDAGFRGLDFRWTDATAKTDESRLDSKTGPTRPVFSFCLPRLRTTDPWRVMPRVGRTVPHEEGIALLESWENSIRVGETTAPNFLWSER